MRSGKVDLLCDGDHAHLARPKSLEQSDLLSSVPAQTVHADNDHGIGTGTPGLQQVGDPTATGGSAKSFVPDTPSSRIISTSWAP